MVEEVDHHLVLVYLCGNLRLKFTTFEDLDLGTKRPKQLLEE